MEDSVTVPACKGHRGVYLERFFTAQGKVQERIVIKSEVIAWRVHGNADLAPIPITSLGNEYSECELLGSVDQSDGRIYAKGHEFASIRAMAQAKEEFTVKHGYGN